MRSISTLLEKFKNILGRDASTKEAILACLKETLFITLTPEDIFVRGDTLEIRTTPVRKSEIKINEEKILEEINLRSGANLKKIFYK